MEGQTPHNAENTNFENGGQNVRPGAQAEGHGGSNGKDGGNIGAIIGIIIIIIIIIVGGWYFLREAVPQAPERSDTAQTQTEEAAPTPEELRDQSSSDEVGAIEADLNMSGLDNLDAEMGDIESEL